MRFAVVLLLLVGCKEDTTGNGCQQDTDCGANNVCARDETCQPASDVRKVTAKWTIRGMPADVVTCTQPNLYIQFDGPDYGDTLGFEPVPCVQGQFNVDKLPVRYGQVELGVADQPPMDTAPIDADTGIATLDLFL
jgi:hypothetical protein